MVHGEKPKDSNLESASVPPNRQEGHVFGTLTQVAGRPLPPDAGVWYSTPTPHNWRGESCSDHHPKAFSG